MRAPSGRHQNENPSKRYKLNKKTVYSTTVHAFQTLDDNCDMTLRTGSLINYDSNDMTWVIWNESFKNSFIESYCFLPKLIKHSLDWWKYANKMLAEIFPSKNSIALSRKLFCNDFCVSLQYIYEVIIYIYSHFSTYFRKVRLTKHKNCILILVPGHETLRWNWDEAGTDGQMWKQNWWI